MLAKKKHSAFFPSMFNFEGKTSRQELHKPGWSYGLKYQLCSQKQKSIYQGL